MMNYSNFDYFVFNSIFYFYFLLYLFKILLQSKFLICILFVHLIAEFLLKPQEAFDSQRCFKSFRNKTKAN